MHPAAGFLKHIHLRPVLCSMLTVAQPAKLMHCPIKSAVRVALCLLQALCLLFSIVCAIGFKVTCSKSHSTARQKAANSSRVLTRTWPVKESER